MSTAQFAHVKSQFPHLKYIKLQGIGEPFLNRDLFALIDMAERDGIRIGLTTNGMVYSERIGEGIKSTRHTSLCISVDAISHDVVQMLRSGSDIALIQKNIGRLRGDNNALGDELAMWTVVSKSNIGELPAIIRFASMNNFRSIVLQLAENDWSRTEIRNAIADRKIDDLSAYRKELDAAKKLAESEKIPLIIYAGTSYTRKQKCPWPFTRAFIDVNGNVVPCCNISDAEVVNMGNVYETSFRKIWNSAPYVQFREDIRRHNLRPYCRNCYAEE